MKKNELKTAREKDSKVLREELSKFRHEAALTRVEISAGQEKNLKKSKLLRKKISQYMTLLKEKENKEK